MIDSATSSPSVNALSGHYSKNKVKRALGYFAAGKVVTGAVSFLTLLLLLRLLTVPDYGAYVAIIALQGIVIMLSSLGLDAAADRFLPELRMMHSEALVRRAVCVAILARSVVLLLFAGIALIGWPLLSGWIGVDDGQAGYVLVGLVLFSGAFNFTGNVLEALLQQKRAQLASVSQVISRFGMYALAYGLLGRLSVDQALQIETVSYVIGLCLSVFTLVLYFRRHATGAPAAAVGTALPPLRHRVARFASLNYAARILDQAQGPHGMRVLASGLLGSIAAAAFGFVMGLTDLVQRYLPSTLLVRLIRPIFVSRYTVNQDFAQINAFARVVLKLNLLFVVPILAFVAAFGDVVVGVVGGGKYAGTEWLLLLALSISVPNAHKSVVSLVANTTERNVLQFQGGVFSLLGLTCGVLSAPLLGLYGILLSALLAAFGYNTFAVWRFRREGVPYSPDLRAGLKIGLAGCAFALLARGGVLAWSGLPGVVLGIGVGVAGFALCIRWLRVFSGPEKQMLGDLLPSRAMFVLAWI